MRCFLISVTLQASSPILIQLGKEIKKQVKERGVHYEQSEEITAGSSNRGSESITEGLQRSRQFRTDARGLSPEGISGAISDNDDDRRAGAVSEIGEQGSENEVSDNKGTVDESQPGTADGRYDDIGAVSQSDRLHSKGDSAGTGSLSSEINHTAYPRISESRRQSLFDIANNQSDLFNREETALQLQIGDQSEAEIVEPIANQSVSNLDTNIKDKIAKINYHYSDSDKIGVGGAKTKYKGNVEAIHLLKKIESENRLAAGEEQHILARYVGWGGMPQAFDAENRDWQNEYAELKEILSEKEYVAARASTLNAHTNLTLILL